MVSKRFSICENNAWLLGVCDAFARYYEIDAIILRIAFLLLLLTPHIPITPFYLLIYIFAPHDYNREDKGFEESDKYD